MEDIRFGPYPTATILCVILWQSSSQRMAYLKSLNYIRSISVPQIIKRKPGRGSQAVVLRNISIVSGCELNLR